MVYFICTFLAIFCPGKYYNFKEEFLNAKDGAKHLCQGLFTNDVIFLGEAWKPLIIIQNNFLVTPSPPLLCKMTVSRPPPTALKKFMKVSISMLCYKLILNQNFMYGQPLKLSNMRPQL